MRQNSRTREKRHQLESKFNSFRYLVERVVTVAHFVLCYFDDVDSRFVVAKLGAQGRGYDDFDLKKIENIKEFKKIENKSLYSQYMWASIRYFPECLEFQDIPGIFLLIEAVQNTDNRENRQYMGGRWNAGLGAKQCDAEA